VEGYFDALALHHFGFENTVATLGTALTSQHGRLLTRYTENVIVFYDADKAGKAATFKSYMPLVGESNLMIKALSLEDSKDPDEFFKKHSKKEMELLIEKAPYFFRWWARGLRKEKPNLTKAEYLQELSVCIPLFVQSDNELYVQMAGSEIESELGLDNRDLLTIVNAERKKGIRKSVKNIVDTTDTKTDSLPNTKPLFGVGDLQMEADFLALLTEQNGEFVPWAVNELSPEVFLAENFRQLFEELSAGDIKPEQLNQVPELEPSFIRIENQSERKHREAMLIDLAAALKKRYVKRQLADLKNRQAEAEKAGDVQQALLLAQQMVILKRQHSQEVESK
jgi:DNA primase